MKNGQIAHRLNQIASLLELTGDNPFKIRAYRNAADTVERASTPVAELIRAGRLYELKGIGRGIGQVIEDLVRTGSSPILTELQAKAPAELPLMLWIPGIGSKSIRGSIKSWESKQSINWRPPARNIVSGN